MLNETLSKSVLEIFNGKVEATTLEQAELVISMFDLVKKAYDKNLIKLPDFYIEAATKSLAKTIPGIEDADVKSLFSSCYMSQQSEKYADVEDRNTSPETTRPASRFITWEDRYYAFRRGIQDWYNFGPNIVGPGEEGLLFPKPH